MNSGLLVQRIPKSQLRMSLKNSRSRRTFKSSKQKNMSIRCQNVKPQKKIPKVETQFLHKIKSSRKSQAYNQLMDKSLTNYFYGKCKSYTSTPHRLLSAKCENQKTTIFRDNNYPSQIKVQRKTINRINEQQCDSLSLQKSIKFQKNNQKEKSEFKSQGKCPRKILKKKQTNKTQNNDENLLMSRCQKFEETVLSKIPTLSKMGVCFFKKIR